MEKIIYQDENGLYFVEYDQSGTPTKVYCDESGNPIVAEEALEIFQQEDGTYYYVAHNELGEAYKVPCDENGNELVEHSSATTAPYVAPVPPVQPQQTAYNNQTNTNAGQAAVFGATGFAGAAAANYTNTINKKKSNTGIKSLAVALLSGLLVIFGGYYAYSQFSNNGNSSFSLFGTKVNMDGYMVDVKFTGNDGSGEAEAKVSAIPNVKVSDSAKQKAIDDLLTNAEISYSKQTSLKNGEQISITVTVDEAAAKKEGVTLEGAFKQSFTVAGLSESKGDSSNSDSKKDSSNGSKESDSKKESTSSEKKETSEEPKKDLEYKQVYNTGYKGLLMRTGPSQSYPAITTLFDGTPVQILEYSGSWAKVNYNGTQGWMYTGYLR